MKDKKKEEEITVKIYKETPGTGINIAAPVKLLKEENKTANAEALKKLAAENQEAKQNEKDQNDTTGEDG
jgi:hypothetical protein